MSRRGLTAIAVLGLWAVGLGFLVRRELFRPDTEMFAEMGLRVTPGAMFYAVMRDGRQVGFASSTIDTTEAGIAIVDILVTDLAGDSTAQRASTRSEIRLSRGMRLQEFSIEDAADGAVPGAPAPVLVHHEAHAGAPNRDPAQSELKDAADQHQHRGDRHRLPHRRAQPLRRSGRRPAGSSNGSGTASARSSSSAPDRCGCGRAAKSS